MNTTIWMSRATMWMSRATMWMLRGNHVDVKGQPCGCGGVRRHSRRDGLGARVHHLHANGGRRGVRSVDRQHQVRLKGPID
eukprot:9470082-Pyramimonas_sp.AAC.1